MLNSKVFISYSRKDSVFAEWLRQRLVEAGFNAFIDKYDIVEGEPWQERLHAIIAGSDTVIFVVTESSLFSKVCEWEVNEAELLEKRILPVIYDDVDLDQAPQRLKRLNFSFLRDDGARAENFQRLVTALNTDLQWVREHTRLIELAARWDQGAHPKSMLLRGGDLAAAERWRDNRPDGASQITPLQASFIAEGRRAAGSAMVRLVSALGAGATALVVITVFALFQREAAIKNESAAVEERNAALSNESRLLGEKSLSAAADGRYVEALKLALDGLPSASDESPRPVVPESIAAYLNATIGSPIEAFGDRAPGTIALAFGSAEGKTGVLHFDGQVEIIDEDNNRSQVSEDALRSLTHAKVRVACRPILARVGQCIEYHNGMSGGCLNSTVLHDLSQGSALSACYAASQAATPSEKVGAQTGNPVMLFRNDGDIPTGWPSYDALTEIVATQPDLAIDVTSKRSGAAIRAATAANASLETLAGLAADDRSLVIYGLADKKIDPTADLGFEIEQVRWLNNTTLVAASAAKGVIYDTSQRKIAASIDLSVVAPNGGCADATIVGLDAQGLVIRADKSSFVTSGKPMPPSGAGSRPVEFFQSGCRAFRWGATASSGEAILNIVDLENAAHCDVAVPAEFKGTPLIFHVNRTFGFLLGESGNYVVFDCATGATTAPREFPVSNLVEIAPLGGKDYFTTLFPDFFGEQAKLDLQVLAVTTDGKGFNVGLTNGEIRQLQLGDYVIRTVERSEDSLILGLDDGLTEAGVRAVGVMPITVDPSVRIIDRMPGTEDIVDYFGPVHGRKGVHYVSKNRTTYDILGPPKPEKTEFCAGTADDSEFFHLSEFGDGSIVAIGTRKVCIVGKDRLTAKSVVPDDQRITDAVVSSKRQLALVNGWRLQMIDLASGASGRFLSEQQDGYATSEGMTSFEAAGVFLAISNEKLLAIDMATSELRPLGGGRSPGTAEAATALGMIAQLADGCLKEGMKPMHVLGASSKDIAAVTVSTEEDGYSILLFSLEAGFCRAIRPTFEGNPYNRPVAFSRDGTRIAILEDDVLLVFDTSTAEQLFRLDAPAFEDLKRLEFDQTGARILAWRNRDKAQPDAETASVWRLPDGKRVELSMSSSIRNAQFAAGGDLVVLLDDDGRSSTFSPDTGKKVTSFKTTQYIAEYFAEAAKAGVAAIGDSVSGDLMLVDIRSGVVLDTFATNGFGTVVGADSSWPANILLEKEGTGFVVATRQSVSYYPVPFSAAAVIAAADGYRSRFATRAGQ